MTRIGINVCNARKKYMKKNNKIIQPSCEEVVDDRSDDDIIKTQIVLPLSQAVKTKTDTLWETFINKRQYNIDKRKEVLSYSSKTYIPSRHPNHLYNGLLRYNGQNNSKFYGETRFWGFYSKLQDEIEETIMMREHEKQLRKWQHSINTRYMSDISISRMMNNRPIYDEDILIFRNRWVKKLK